MKTFSWQFDAYGDPGKNLQWREQELDEPGPGQALVKIKAPYSHYSKNILKSFQQENIQNSRKYWKKN